MRKDLLIFHAGGALSESDIVRVVAKEAARHIIRRTIAHLQSMKDTLSGEDSGLNTTWDEICVQVQGQHSFFWDTYDEIVRSTLRDYVGKLKQHEKEALWLQTNEGDDWTWREPEEREAYPVYEDDIVDYLVGSVYSEADDWSNVRIRAFLERTMGY